MKFLIWFFLTATAALAESRTLVLIGTVTNTTGDITAPARLELKIDDGKIAAQLVTSPPLTGSGALSGREVDGWCELGGTVEGGFALKFRGILHVGNFRGTYTAKPENGLTQYGRFELTSAKPN